MYRRGVNTGKGAGMDVAIPVLRNIPVQLEWGVYECARVCV